MQVGVDNVEQTGLTSALAYAPNVMLALKNRMATGRVAGGSLYWTPTVEGRWNFDRTVTNPEELDDDCQGRGCKADTIADIRAAND